MQTCGAKAQLRKNEFKPIFADMADCCCTPPPLNLDTHKGNAAEYRRVLWAVLAINAIMFLIEVGAGLRRCPCGRIGIAPG
jgi:hypothetical protein